MTFLKSYICIFLIITILLMMMTDSSATRSITFSKVNPFGNDFFHIDNGYWYVQGSYWDNKIRSGQFSPQNISAAPPYVKVLMIGPYNDDFPKKLQQGTCDFFYDVFGVHPKSSPVIGVYIAFNDDMYPENLSRPYFVYCKPPDLEHHVPLMMTLKTPNFEKEIWHKDLSGYKREWIWHIRGQMDYASWSNQSKKLMVCTKPFQHGPLHDYPHILNFITILDVLGVQHFLLYDAGDATPLLYKILNIAIEVGISIEVRPWHLIEYHGWMMHQTIHQEMCMYEAMILGFENVMTVDYDEIIVPHSPVNGTSNPTLIDLLNNLDSQYPNAAFYRFNNVFYPMEHANHKNADSLIISLQKHQHMIETPEYSRSKCIYKPHRVGEVYTHFGLPANISYEEVRIIKSIAYVHHYRNKVFGGDMAIFEDTTMWNYSDLIVRNRFYKAMYPYFTKRT